MLVPIFQFLGFDFHILGVGVETCLVRCMSKLLKLIKVNCNSAKLLWGL